MLNSLSGIHVYVVRLGVAVGVFSARLWSRDLPSTQTREKV